MTHLYLSLIFLFTTLFQVHSQSSEFDFIDYLIAKGELQSAILAIEQIANNGTAGQTDSIHYYKGWVLYSQKQLEKSANELGQVTASSVFSPKAPLFAAYNHLHLGNYTQAQTYINRIQPTTTTDSLILLYMQSGISLLQNNWENYQAIRPLIPNDFYGFAKELKILDDIYEHTSQRKQKSPLVAALLSAIIPGSGKIYLGKTGQGISSMLMVTGMGLVTAENYRKNGPTAFSTLFLGTVFTSFYIGNIYGSAKLARVAEYEFNTQNNAKILFHIHIPLRNLYN
jgi:hypothetical protein